MFISVFLQDCLSCSGCFRTCIVNGFCWLILCFSTLLSETWYTHKIILSGAGLIFGKSGQLVSSVGSFHQTSFLFHKAQFECCAGCNFPYGGRKRSAEGKKNVNRCINTVYVMYWCSILVLVFIDHLLHVSRLGFSICSQLNYGGKGGKRESEVSVGGEL